MATPKGPQNVLTPKNPLTSTPSRHNASPHPNSGAFGSKTLAYKSPAVKTPASLHGHSYRISTSSQPMSTPLAAPAIHDELLNLNSPATALIASMGNAGLTPLTSAQDGLGITTGITLQATRDAALNTRTPEAQRLARLEQVAKLLKTKVAGRGISREGVERLAQIQGFTILWDEENLTIAGNSVDLEIIFAAIDRHVVRDVQLKLNTASSDEPQLQEDATAILKHHLMTSEEFTLTNDVWKSLKDFSADLEYLSQLDYIGSPVSCFQVIGNLYDTFRKIWAAEKKKMHDRREAYQVCHGNVGWPVKDSNNRLGIATQFWIERQDYDGVAFDVNDASSRRRESWHAYFSCRKGGLGVRADQKWLADEPLISTVTAQDVFQESPIEKPDWTDDSGAGNKHANGKDAGAMILDDPSDLQENLNLTFTCRIEPPILIPMNVANELNSASRIVDLDQSGAITYQQSLLNACQPATNVEWDIGTRWAKTVSVIDSRSELSTKKHSYSLFSSGMVWSCPVTNLEFLHPRHFAESLPILRQYALLWSLLRSTLGNDLEVDLPQSFKHGLSSAPTTSSKPRLVRRSNKQAAQGKLNEVLSNRQGDNESLRVDLSLDVITDPTRARIEVIIPVARDTVSGKGVRFLRVVIDVCRNGKVEVAALTGVAKGDQDGFKQKAIKILRLSEDLSILIEWLLEKVVSISG